jgi:uncharacterized protein (TIGR02266 family)
MPEKRIHPRLAIDVKVSMNTESNFYAGITENISEGGIFIATYDNFPLGSTMDLTVSLPGQPPVQVKGVVRWVREHNQFTDDVSPGVGVAFTDLPEGTRNLIESFIRSRSPLLYEEF